MLPAFTAGRVVIATNFYRSLHPGDVVIIRHGGLEKMKRISKLHDNRLFVTGDNHEHSTDSRSFGWLDITSVAAKVVWPVRNITKG